MYLSLTRTPGKFIPGKINPPLLLTLFYLTVSVVWIISSDDLVEKLAAGNPLSLHHLQHYKGLIFVFLSSVVIYLASSRYYSNLLSAAHQRKLLEIRFFALNQAANEGIFDIDFTNRTIEINRPMQELAGIDTKSLDEFWLGLASRMTRGDRRRLLDGFNNFLASGKTTWKTESFYRDDQGVYHPTFCSLYLIVDEKTSLPIRLVGTVIDVSELRNLQAEKYEQQLKFKRNLAAAFVRAQEIERNRWAQELHDNVGQLLTVSNLYLGQMNRKPETIDNLLPEARKLVTESIAEIRHLSAALKPPVFSEVSLAESVDYLIAGINRVKEIKFSVDIHGLREQDLAEEHKLLIYRIVQEQLNNILKYADASQVNIYIIQDKDLVQLQIRDNGKGFDTKIAGGGIGLKNMRSRLQLYQGQLHIQSSTGNGCMLGAQFRLN